MLCPYQMYQVAKKDEILYDLNDMCHPTLLSETCSPQTPNDINVGSCHEDLDCSFDELDIEFWQMMIDVGTCEIIPRGDHPKSQYNVEVKIERKLLNIIPFLDLTSFNTRILSFCMD